MPQPDLLKLSKKNISQVQRNGLPNGLISLKGGELGNELKTIAAKTEVADLSRYFEEPFFDTKKLVYTIC